MTTSPYDDSCKLLEETPTKEVKSMKTGSEELT